MNDKSEHKVAYTVIGLVCQTNVSELPIFAKIF